MPNPRKQQQQIENEDLVIQTVRGLEASSSQHVDDSIEINEPDLTTLEAHLMSIYQQHPVRPEYNAGYSVYLNPTDKDQYILLTSAHAHVWARALCDRVPGVTLDSPPGALPFLSRSNEAKRRAAAASGTSSVDSTGIHSLLQALVNHQSTQAPTMAMSLPPASVSGDGPGSISQYLNFVRITHNKQEVMEILEHNDIDDFKMFRPSYFSIADLKQLGLTMGVIGKLRNSVAKYKATLHA